MDEHRAACGHARPPSGEVIGCGPVAVRAVDVEEVYRARDFLGRLPRRPADVSHPIADPRGGDVGSERLEVRSAFLESAVNLAWASVVPGVRIDGDDSDARSCGTGEQDRRPAAVGADLDDLPACLDRTGAVPEPSGLAVRHPPLDVTHAREGLVEALASCSRTRRIFGPWLARKRPTLPFCGRCTSPDQHRRAPRVATSSL